MAIRSRRIREAGPRGGLAASLALVAAFAAPLRSAEEEQPAGGAPEPAREAQDAGPQEDELVTLFEDVSKNMDLIEQMLKKSDSGEETQGRQAAVTRDLDNLIEELKKRQSTMESGSGGGAEQREEQGEGKKKGERAEKKQRPGQGSSGRKPEQPKPQGKKESSAGKVPNTESAPEKPPPSGVAGQLKERSGSSGWGFLPGEIRALLDAQRRSGVPAKYAELIRRYFERLAEEGADGK